MKDLLENGIFELIVEGIGLIFGIGVFCWVVFGGGLADIVRIFSQVFLG